MRRPARIAVTAFGVCAARVADANRMETKTQTSERIERGIGAV
jgi:hypothetical protein